MVTEPKARFGAKTVIRLSGDVYSLGAVKNAAYQFMSRAHVGIDKSNDEIVCTIHPLNLDDDVLSLARDFEREVLDQDLREKIAEETADVRNAILAHAFSRAGILNE